MQYSTHYSSSTSIPLGLIGLIVAVPTIVALCINHARRVKGNYTGNESAKNNDLKMSISPLPPVKQFITTISNKQIPFTYKKKAIGDDHDHETNGENGEEEFGEGGLWQKGILMGEKCQPPEFPGVIYYDSCGNQISEFPPRSPRASPLYTFSFQSLAKEET